MTTLNIKDIHCTSWVACFLCVCNLRWILKFLLMLIEYVLNTTSEVLDPQFKICVTKIQHSQWETSCSKEYRISSFEGKKNYLVFLPNGVSTKIALKSSVGFEAMLTASICSKLPNGWHLGTSSAMGRWCNVPVIKRITLSII